MPANGDPVRRTAEVTFRAANNTATPEDVEELVRFLDAYKAAPEALRHRAGVDSYDDVTVDVLRHTAGMLQRVAGAPRVR